MMCKKLISVFSFFLILQEITAQNINGFEIPVSKDKLSSITFHSEVANFYFESKNPPYKVSTLGNNAIMIQTSQVVKEPYNLFVIEGGRKHRFVLVYKEEIDLAEQDPDYSDLKQLDKLIKDFNDKQVKQPLQINSSAVDQSQNKNNTKPDAQPKSNNTTGDNSVNDNFYALMEAGDKSKSNQQLDEAKNNYQKALQLKPGNQYAQNALTEVNKLIENKSAANYQEIIIKANTAFNLNRFDESLKYYNDALSIRTDDVWSANQIKIIQKKQADAKTEEANRQKDSLFNNYLNAGDNALAGKSYDEASIAYGEALKTKPGDPVAALKLNSVHQKMLTDSLSAVNKRNEDAYISFMNNGNKAMQEKAYDEAKMAYNEALKIKPGDVVATSKLNSIDQQQASDRVNTEQAKNESIYNDYIKSGDEAFRNDLYDVAKSDYSEALKIKPDNIYAKTQIKKIDDALEKTKLQAQKELELQKNQEREKQYNDIIKLADSYYNSGMYSDARDAYSKALEVNNKDLYSKNKISQIDNLIAQQKGKIKQDSLSNLKYTSAILKADDYFNNNDYSNAKSFYAAALKYKTDDEYAKNKLEQIQTTLQEIDTKGRAAKDSIAKNNETTKQYNALITKAKAAFNKNDYVMAKGFYVSANNLKPDEAEAKNKITEIDGMLDKIAVQSQQKIMFDSLSAAAEAALVDSDYSAALFNFNEALKLGQPDQLYYINKQITYAQKQISAKDSINNQAKQAEVQEEKMDKVISTYKQGKDALKKGAPGYDSALLYFKQFVSSTESLDFVSNKYDLISLVKFSKSKINDISAYLERQKNQPKDTALRKLPDVKSLPSIMVITYYNPKDPKLEAIYKKYPDIDFNRSPDNQLFDSISDYSIENKLISKNVMSATPVSISENSSNGIKLLCQNIIFIGSKVYIKLMLQNSTSEEFLTGTMLLTQKKQNDSAVRILPNYVAGYPIILANKEKVIVYVTHSKEISDNDNLDFEVTDRLNKIKVAVTIPGSIYNRERKNIHQ